MSHPQLNRLFEYCKKGQTQALLNALNECNESDLLNERGHSLLCVSLKNAQWETARALLSEDITSNPSNPVIISACQCVLDDISGIEILLEKNTNINQQNEQKRTALMTACLLGHVNKVDKLIASGALSHIQDLEGNTALIEAINSKNKDVLEKILQLKPDVNQSNHNQETALMIAVQQKTPVEDMIKQLLSAGADPELLDAEKKSAWLIAKQKHPKIARQIEKHLNTINQIELPFFSNDYTQTEIAETKETSITQTEALQSSQAETLHPSKIDKPIIQKTKTSQPFMLHKKKAIKTNEQEWFHAAKNGNLGGLNRMIVEGIDIDCVDSKGCTALIRASGNSRRAVVSFLLQQKASIEIRSNNGSTALSSSVIGNCRYVAGLLLDKKANPNGLGPSNYTYATIAAAQWNDAMLSILYRHGADIFITNNKQQNLLHIVALAAEYYNNINQAKTTMQFLIDHGINLDAQDNDGNTALLLLCGSHKIRYKVDDRLIASLTHSIIKLGAATAITNNAGKSALDAAHHHKLQQTKGVLMNALSWNTR